MYLVSYDIEKDSLRTKIGKRLIAEGLHRIQYSVYLGQLKKEDYLELLKWLKQAMQKSNQNKDSVIILFLERPQVKNMTIIGAEKLDISELLDEKDVLSF